MVNDGLGMVKDGKGWSRLVKDGQVGIRLAKGGQRRPKKVKEGKGWPSDFRFLRSNSCRILMLRREKIKFLCSRNLYYIRVRN